MLTQKATQIMFAMFVKRMKNNFLYTDKVTTEMVVQNRVRYVLKSFYF